jgi:hypothetical protein
MRAKPIQVLGVVLLLLAIALLVRQGAFISRNDTETQASDGERRGLPSTSAGRNRFFTKEPDVTPKEFKTNYTIERLSAEHDRVPTEDDWRELTRILLDAGDGEVVDAVKARFSVHAGKRALETLITAYENPANDNTRQRIIEIFSTLQSMDFPEVARRILNDPARPITDHLVCACALSLVRKGEPQDIQAIFSRTNSAGEDPEPGGSPHSDADGLMYAISEARSPGLEQLLMDAAAGRGAATTGRARYAAAAALGNYHTVPVTELLYDLSKNESNEQIRRQAERSLKAIQTNE